MASNNHFPFTKLEYPSPDQWIRLHDDPYDQLHRSEELSMAEKISSPELAPFPPSLFMDDHPMTMVAQDQYLHLLPPFPPQVTAPATINNNNNIINIGPTHSVFGLSTDIGEDILPLLLDHQDTISTCWPINLTPTPTTNPFFPQGFLTESSSINVNLDKQRQNNHVYPTTTLYPSISNNYRDPIPAAVPVPVPLGFIQNTPPPPPANAYGDHLNSETTSSPMDAVNHEVEYSTTATCSTTLVDSESIKKEETNDMMVPPVHRAVRKKKQNNYNNDDQKIEVLNLDEIKDYFEVPISTAAKELNVGLTILKKRCRELRIKRWPHRKIKSLRGLIRNVQELGLVDEVAVLEDQIRMLKKLPQLELTESTKKLRQACFKANYKKRRMATCPSLSATTRTPRRRRRQVVRLVSG